MTAWGLTVVVLAMRVPSPWGGEPLALPLMVRLHRKSTKGATEEEEELSLIELGAWMVFRLIEWLPNHRFRLVADGAYAPLLRYEFPRTTVITRIRCDAALFDLAPPRTGRRGRPRTKGERLAKPLGLAAELTDDDWTTVPVCVRGQMVERKLWSRVVLWYETARSRPHLLVIVRDPSGHQHDDFFITSDTALSPTEVAELYSDRWANEDANRNLKQYSVMHGRGGWIPTTSACQLSEGSAEPPRWSVIAGGRGVAHEDRRASGPGVGLRPGPGRRVLNAKRSRRRRPACPGSSGATTSMGVEPPAAYRRPLGPAAARSRRATTCR